MTNKNSHIDETLLMQFLLGEASAEQMQSIEKWLHESEENRKELDQLESVWAETGKLTPKPVAVDVLNAWEKVSKRVDTFEQISKPAKIHTLNKRILKYTYRAAAVLIVAFGIFKVVIEPKLPVEQLAYTTTTHIYKGTLPDGSKIALNLNSKISYPEKFKNKTREVQLEGEAYFEVAHNPKKPFIISAGEAKIRVLGTSFNVKANTDSDVEVSVTTGRVQLFKIDSVSGDTASVFLTAGQKGVLPKSASKPEKLDKPIEPDEMFWMDRTLVFKQVKLSKVIEMLQKYYHVNITVENPMALECKYTATFNDADIDEILDMLANTFNFELKVDAQNYTLKGNGCLDE